MSAQQAAKTLALPAKLMSYSLSGFSGGALEAHLALLMDEMNAPRKPRNQREMTDVEKFLICLLVACGKRRRYASSCSQARRSSGAPVKEGLARTFSAV